MIGIHHLQTTIIVRVIVSVLIYGESMMRKGIDLPLLVFL